MKYTVEVRDDSDAYVSSKALDVRNCMEAMDDAERYMRLKAGHHVLIYNRFNHHVATIYEDGHVKSVKSKEATKWTKSKASTKF